MCSRFELTSNPRDLARRFGLADSPPLPNRAEIRPTNQALVVRRAGLGELMPWGLKPEWSSKPLINARAETLAEKRTFMPLLENRCLVPASAYFEWRTADDGKKLKNRIAAEGAPLLAFAGLHDGEAFTIVTCRPAPAIAHIHDRMPVILDAGAEEEWLDASRPFADVAPLLIPYASTPLTATEDTPPPPAQSDLFG